MKKTFLFLAAALMSAAMWAGETKTLIIDGSQLTGTVTAAETDFTYGDFTIAMSDGAKQQASSGDNKFEGTDKAILIGKSGKYIYNKTPFGKITKFEIYANKGASAKVSVGVLFSTTAISEYATGDNTYTATLSTLDNVYDCSANIPEGAQYFWYQVTNANNSQVMFRITYEESDTPQKELVSIAVSGTPNKTTYEAGETFNPAGLTVTGTYSDASEKTITSGITWNVTPSGALTAGIISVSVTATVDGITNEPAYVVDGLTVTEHVQTYANTYTSNVELTTTGGTSASAAKVVIGGTQYDAIKAGTGSAAGACVVTIPANTKTLHFHAAGWNGETVVLNDTINLVADAGVSGNSPFTLKNDPETQDYFTLDPQGATTITFTATSGKRFVLFGVNAELQEGVVAAPTFTPTESEFDGSVEVTLTADEGADIYFTLDGTTPVAGQSTSYEGPFTLTATTTIKAIAEKGGKTSEVAEKTYTKIPVFESLETLVTNLPAAEMGVTVIVTIAEAKIDSFYVTSKEQTNGVYTHVGETVVELYEYNVPEAWKVGGTLSATTLKAQWLLYKGTAELQKWDNGWTVFNYTAPSDSTALQDVMMKSNIRKAMRNGHVFIMRDGKMFNMQGMIVK